MRGWLSSDIVTGEVFLDTYGYAGAPVATNNPVWQLERDVGPLPEGKYFMGTPREFHGMDKGMKVLPDVDTDTFRRGAFRIHGPGAWSAGRLALGCSDRAAIAARGGGYLQVF
jgi:hypothetical protein